MSRHLVVAHQTVTSPNLLEVMKGIADEDPDAQFTLLIPRTRVENLLTWTEGESRSIAEQAAETAKDMFEYNGLTIEDTIIGDESPVQAVDDVMAANGPYEAPFATIIVSTFPPGLSRWLKLDPHNRIRQRYDIPVISVVAPREEAHVS